MAKKREEPRSGRKVKEKRREKDYFGEVFDKVKNGGNFG